MSAAAAVAMAHAGLAYLASADMASLPAAAQAECLRGLERAESLHTAARAGALAAFISSGGCQDDGQGTARAWLRWQTRITNGAAAGAVGWARRLAAHPAVGEALAAGEISASWAREICSWTAKLPEGKQADADQILLAAAAGGAELADLAGLAEEMRRRCAQPDTDADDGFADRWLRLDRTLHGAGRVEGDLTPQCTAALDAVLDAFSKKTGPEDTRTRGQRTHDGLEEACRQLIASGCVPDRAGQPTQIQLHMTLDQLRGLDDAASAEAAWAQAAWAARGPAAAPGSDCDAVIVPVVSGHVDPAVWDQLTTALLSHDPARPGEGAPPTRYGPGSGSGAGSGFGLPTLPEPQPPYGQRSPDGPQSPKAATVRRLILHHAADLLSGPAGLAAFLRTGLLDSAAGSISLPLDVGRATKTIPDHLRRAVITRDRCCRFPGCRQRPAACQAHHVKPRSQGGATSLTNLILLCAFHHLTAIHRWGWHLTLHPDGTTTAVSPDKQRTLNSHGPPARAA